jgi:hypothetical protein
MTMEVVELFCPLSSDYIKYLNDPESLSINYDQWKDKKRRLEMKKNSGHKKNDYYLKYNY